MRLRTPNMPAGAGLPGRGLESGARGEDDALRRGRADEGPDGRAAIVRLAAFAPLAAFAAAHWATLVADPPRWRLAGAIAAATLCGGLLVASSRLVARRPLLLVGVRAAAVAVCAVLALLVTGVPFAALAPGGWDELVGGIARGFDGLGGVEWPYAGGDGWVRLTVLLAVPFVGVVTAALAFWPTASGQAGRDAAVARRVAALVVLLTMFAVAAAERPLPAEIGRGVLLLVLLSAWLFLPRLPRARRATALAAAVALLAAGAVSLPLAVAIEPDRPWIDYRTWGLWGGAGGAPGRFNWDHSYGPLDWPRTGETMLEVRSRRPHFWRVQALDRFDGYGWRTSGRRRAPGGELPAGLRLDSRRRERAGFTVRGLRSELLATAGTPLAVAGAGVVAIFADGSAQPLGMLPAPGDSYGVEAYVPEPSAATMRAASGPPPVFARDYTQIDLPAPRRSGEEGIESGAGAGSLARTPSPPVRVNLGVAGDAVPTDPGAEARVLASPYGGVLRLTRRLARGQRTDYDVVKSVERYLRRGYAYSEAPPAREHPLAAFLFEDRIGYCQQFSGAMALMLRMHGIPSRVATGFAPGVRQGRGRWRVRDLDAHSWVEVYFSGLGWVAFDPTPASAPAERPAEDDAEADAAASASGPERDQADPQAPGGAVSEERADPAAGPDEETNQGISGPALALGSLLVLALGAAALRVAASGRTGGHAAASRSLEQDVAELRTALERLGYELSPRTTLSALERTLAAQAGPGAARYVRRLRERRFRSADAASAVPRLDRRALRSALVAGRGPLARARGFLALPPAALRARR